jgi:hypothetical protein
VPVNVVAEADKPEESAIAWRERLRLRVVANGLPRRIKRNVDGQTNRHHGLIVRIRLVVELSCRRPTA